MTLISHARKFIFFHFPKNAGNSIYEALNKYRDDELYQALGNQEMGYFSRKVMGVVASDLKNKETYRSLELSSKLILKVILHHWSSRSARLSYKKFIFLNQFSKMLKSSEKSSNWATMFTGLN